MNASAGSSTGCNADYDGVAGSLTFAPGETTKVVRVDLFDCGGIPENLELFLFELSTAGSASIVRASGRVGIVDNGSIVDTPLLFVRDAVVDERDATARVSVLLGGPHGQASNSTVTVDYQTVNGTASAGSDYTTTSGTLTFAPGETVKTVLVPISDDGSPEGSESFAVDLSGADLADISDSSGLVVIGASDARPGLAAVPVCDPGCGGR